MRFSSPRNVDDATVRIRLCFRSRRFNFGSFENARGVIVTMSLYDRYTFRAVTGRSGINLSLA